MPHICSSKQQSILHTQEIHEKKILKGAFERLT